MSKLYEEQTGKRCLIRRNGKNYYLWVGQKSIMISGPGESDIANAEEYAMLNAICRVASKAMAYGLPMIEIADQLDKSRLSDSRTWVADLAMVLRECA